MLSRVLYYSMKSSCEHKDSQSNYYHSSSAHSAYACLIILHNDDKWDVTAVASSCDMVSGLLTSKKQPGHA